MRTASSGSAVWAPRTALAALVIVLLFEIGIIARSLEIWFVAAVAAWMALPGVVFAAYSLGGRAPAWRSAWFIGPALGFGFSVFGLLLLWAAGFQSGLVLVLAPIFTGALALIARRFGGAALRLPALDRRDVVAASVALLVVPLVTIAPYGHVAEKTFDGEAYRAYFTADFVWAMSVTAELAKGDVPPANPFLSTQPMRYYWMSHLLSGAVYRNVRSRGVTAEQVILFNGLAFGMAFVAFFYWLARAAGGGPALSAVAVGIGFLANSYEGLDMLRALSRRDQAFDAVRMINIDAVTRWFYQGMPVDGLQRLLLYQPHHLTGYVLALSALWLVGLADQVSDVSVALWAGILLGLAFLFSTFTAIILGGAVGVLYAIRLVQQRALRFLPHCAILGAAPVVLGIGISTALGYTDSAEGFLLQFGLNPVALRRWPYMLLLSFGPLLFTGIAGLLRWRWLLGPGTAAGAIVLSALVFYFTADVPDMGGVWVGWRSGHLLLIALSVISAAGMTAAWQRRAFRVPLVLVMLVAIIPALPTVAIDVYNAQDITNRAAGPSFPWTLVITPPEREAFHWVQRATPADSLVQVEPFVRDAGTWAYVPAFAERRMAAGLPISMIPLQPYRIASEIVRSGIFRTVSAVDAHATARELRIDYLLVGEVERRHYGPSIALINASPDLFLPVFQNTAVTIYRIVK